MILEVFSQLQSHLKSQICLVISPCTRINYHGCMGSTHFDFCGAENGIENEG